MIKEAIQALGLDIDKDYDKDKEQQILVIPNSSVNKRKGREVVFKVKDEKAQEIQVQLGRKFGNYVEVISGLSAGEQIIENLSDKIDNGTEVKVL